MMPAGCEPPVADRRGELLGRVGLHEVAGAFDDYGVVVGEDLLPSPSLLGPESEVGVAPHDERRERREVVEPGLDTGEKAPTR